MGNEAKLKSGQRFNQLVVLRRLGSNVDGKATWLCKCSCGKETVATSYALRNGTKKSCGCRKNAPRGTMDIAGEVYGCLKATKRAGKNRRGQALWECECSCGNTITVPANAIRQGNTKSCGCLKRIGSLRTHGMSRTPEYTSWCAMKARCNNPNNDDYASYGGRGIKVCNRWDESFEAFLEDMGMRPFARATVERIDNDGDYHPGNCRWASQKDQTRNKRTSKNVLAYDGLEMTIGEWAEITGIPYRRIQARLARGWRPADAVSLMPLKRSQWNTRKKKAETA